MDEFGEQRGLPRMDILLIPGECRCLMNRIGRRENWALRSLLALTAAIYVGSAGIPSLLDDADSFYAEVVREMALRHDWVTPYANGLRFFDKPPLFYWLISLSNTILHTSNAFTVRLPTALAVLALVFVTFKIGELLWGFRVGLFSGLALATSAGMFLFTRIALPDALMTLLLTLFLYSFLLWERAENKKPPLLWMYAFAALAVMAKGLIGLVFPLMILLATLAATSRLREAARLLSLKGALLFAAIAVPWHLLIGARNHGFFWFYFINEHLLRFLGKRFPMDYGTVPLIPFWLLHLVWLFPWSIYLLALCRPSNFKRALTQNRRGLVLLLAWAFAILIFFSFSSRLEYYTLPALPALALLAGMQCASCWERGEKWPGITLAVLGALCGAALIAVAAYDSPTMTESFLKLKDNSDLYVYYLGHLFDLTPESLAALRTPLVLAGIGLGVAFPLHHFFKRMGMKATVLALGMGCFFVAANLGFLIFAPRLTSRPVADEINRRWDASSTAAPAIVIDGEYEEASSVAFYTGRMVLIHHEPSSSLWYGSRYADAPSPMFLDDSQLKQLWNESKGRVFLVTFQPKLAGLENVIPQSRFVLSTYGDKILLSNRADAGVRP